MSESFIPNPLPSLTSTLPGPEERNITVARDLSLPFRRNVTVNIPRQAFSTPLNFKVLFTVNHLTILWLIISFNRIHRILALKLLFAMSTTRQTRSVM